ncbi:MAG: YigZ family protein [Ruminococcaceae bacterium]|nr:YigZ family protein [Oscillospiraceae bacterium]
MDYLTIENEAIAQFEVKNSKFIGYIKPVTTNEEATAFINEIKQKHWDARHNVYAYSLKEDQIKRYSDDGEPSGTAGLPVLDILNKEEVCDCVVVVTRYFGGTLLGTGGLVRAYSKAASLALKKAGIIKMSLHLICETTLDYNLYGKFQPLVIEQGGQITDTGFAEDVKLTFQIPKASINTFNKAFQDLSCGNGNYTIIEEQYRKTTMKNEETAKKEEL